MPPIYGDWGMEQIPSPTFASPASPSDVSDSPGVRPRGSDWKLMPVFATGSLNSGQPQFVLVHAPKPKARSADLACGCRIATVISAVQAPLRGTGTERHDAHRLGELRRAHMSWLLQYPRESVSMKKDAPPR
eukprot:s2777_g1.t1